MGKSLNNTQMLARDVVQSIHQFNSAYGKAYTLGSNWSSVGTDFETIVNKFLFPKLTQTTLINIALGNRFNWLAKEVEFIGQLSEEYVILDSVPTNMDITREEELMLKRNYPPMATKLYGPGLEKKQKFTLNDNDVRLNFANLKDAISWAVGVYKKKLSDINVAEEREMKAMLIDYSLRNTKEKRSVSSLDDLSNKLFTAFLNLQNNNDKYNEADTASGGTLGRYTTVSSLNNLIILTTDDVKSYLLNTRIANTFQEAGIDLTSKIMSFDTLGGNYRMTDDVTISDPDTLSLMQRMGDYQVRLGSIVPKDSVLTYDISQAADFAGKFEEIKPATDLYAYVLDINKIRYRRSTNNMLEKPWRNPEFQENTYWLHYNSFKAMSPFFNSILLGE